VPHWFFGIQISFRGGLRPPPLRKEGGVAQPLSLLFIREMIESVGGGCVAASPVRCAEWQGIPTTLSSVTVVNRHQNELRRGEGVRPPLLWEGGGHSGFSRNLFVFVGTKLSASGKIVVQTASAPLRFGCVGFRRGR